MKPRYFLGRMDVIKPQGGAQPPTHRVQIEIELASEELDPDASEVREAILATMDSRILRVVGDSGRAGEMSMVPVAWVRQILAEPIKTEIAGIKIWGLTLQRLPRIPRK
jgi:hypothetical protein